MDVSNLIAAGNTADIYLSEGRIIKLFASRLPDGYAAFEANKQQSAYACGLPVPQIFDVTHINGRPLLWST